MNTKAILLSIVLGANLVIIQTGCAINRSQSLTADAANTAAGNACPWLAAKNVLLSPALLALSDGQSPLTQYQVPITPSGISKDQARADIACLKLIYQRAYAGTEFYKVKGVDLDSRADSLSASLSDEVVVESFTKQLFDLHAGAADSHLAYFRRDGELLRFTPVDGYRTTETFRRLADGTFKSIDGPERIIVGCTDFLPRPFLSDDGVSSYVFVGQSAEAIASASCQTRHDGSEDDQVSLEVSHISPTLNAAEDEGVSSKAYLDEAKTLLYARVPSMADFGQADSAILEAFRSTNLRGAILDLRGNGGGENHFADQLERVIKSRDEARENIDTEDWISHMSLAGILNYTFFDWHSEAKKAANRAQSEAVDAAYFPAFQNLRQNFYLPIVQSTGFHELDKQLDGDDDGRGSRASKWLVPLVIVYDQGCASACETVMERLKRVPSVRLAGVPSTGAEMISNPGLYELPNSKILVQLGMRRNIYFGAVNAQETKGHMPDLLLLQDDNSDVIDSLKNCFRHETCLSQLAAVPKGPIN